jgi:hypothetical protein
MRILGTHIPEEGELEETTPLNMKLQTQTDRITEGFALL